MTTPHQESLSVGTWCPEIPLGSQPLEAAVAGDYAPSYATTAVRGLYIASVTGYLQQLRRVRYRLARHPGESLRTAIDEHLLSEVQQEHTKSNSKRLLSGVRLLEKFNWLQPTIGPAV